ncbi:MAG: hypothetical protein K2X32_02995, partial [Phycisphaerales bacterium]|nr:hypothetical protein [Phycisphaerales bacterium]
DFRSEFGDRNKSVCAFLDGHAAYVELLRVNVASDPAYGWGMGSLTSSPTAPAMPYSFRLP